MKIRRIFHSNDDGFFPKSSSPELGSNMDKELLEKNANELVSPPGGFWPQTKVMAQCPIDWSQLE